MTGPDRLSVRTLARAESAVYVTDYRTVVRAKQLSKTMQDPYVTVAVCSLPWAVCLSCNVLKCVMGTGDNCLKRGRV